MTTGSDNYGSNGAASADDRFGAQLGGHNGATPTVHRINGSLDMSNPIASSLRTPHLVETELDDPGYSADRWFDAAAEPLADHPLLRGLLLELPPKGSMPTQEWLDRWFEAARSILELLYAQSTARR
ncbi:hypothetical protein ACNTMW_10385 [Planosporangium sp. 12N6]|uniref:hypothetical protein n=1 Tax=Planosporangium spinosum TaxID=3402278 RepID=UPI003CEBA093